MADTICADYVLEEKVGGTATAAVFRGRHARIAGRLRAVKVPLAESEGTKLAFTAEAVKEAFGRRCEVAAQVAQAMDAAAPSERGGAQRLAFIESMRPDMEQPYLISEWLAGGSLADRLAKGPLSAPEAVRIAAAVLEGLGFAHAHGIVHGNMKPTNILFTADGAPRLSDFGSLLGSSLPPDPGSVPYLSPEQLDPGLLKGQPLDGCADLFSLALIFYEMLAGRRAPRVLTAALLPSRLNSGAPAALDEVIVRALQPDPGMRFRDAETMRRALLEGLEGGPGAVVSVPAADAPAEEAEALPVPGAAERELVGAALAATGVAEQDAAAVAAQGPEAPAAPERRAGETRTNEADGAEMVWVPGGTLLMGSEESDSEQPVHEVPVVGFWIYRYPVTQEQYLKFLSVMNEGIPAGQRRVRPNTFRRGDQHARKAAAGVGWEEAVEYCKWAGVRLPAEPEWEWAARGAEARRYPWGNAWDPGKANTSESGTGEQSEVDRHPSGASWCGAEEMSGNVAEWCSSVFKPYPYAADDGREDPSAGGARVLRGGSAESDADSVRCAFRRRPGAGANLTGLRPVCDDQ